MTANRTLALSILSNILLAAGKIITGLIGGSIVLTSDGFHSLADLSTDLICVIAVLFSRKPKDQSHPYGHKRIEDIGSLILGLILLGSVVGIIIEAAGKIVNQEHLVIHQNLTVFLLMLFWALLTLPLKEYLFRISIKSAELENSISLKANAWHHRSDAMTSLVAAVAISVGFFIPSVKVIIDVIGAVIILIYVGKIGVDFVIQSVNALMDRSPSPEFLNMIITTAKDITEVKSVSKPQVRNLGGEYWIDLKIQLNGDISLNKAHQITHQVREHIMENMPQVVEVMIHTEPEGQ